MIFDVERWSLKPDGMVKIAEAVKEILTPLFLM